MGGTTIPIKLPRESKIPISVFDETNLFTKNTNEKLLKAWKKEKLIPPKLIRAIILINKPTFIIFTIM